MHLKKDFPRKSRLTSWLGLTRCSAEKSHCTIAFKNNSLFILQLIAVKSEIKTEIKNIEIASNLCKQVLMVYFEAVRLLNCPTSIWTY